MPREWRRRRDAAARDLAFFAFFGQAAAHAAEYVHVPFLVRAFEKPGDQVGFLRHPFFADRALTLDIPFREGVAVGTAENMHQAFPVPGKNRGLDLLAVFQHRPAYRAHALISYNFV